jgi:hypothetical protein
MNLNEFQWKELSRLKKKNLNVSSSFGGKNIFDFSYIFDSFIQYIFSKETVSTQFCLFFQNAFVRISLSNNTHVH